MQTIEETEEIDINENLLFLVNLMSKHIIELNEYASKLDTLKNNKDAYSKKCYQIVFKGMEYIHENIELANMIAESIKSIESMKQERNQYIAETRELINRNIQIMNDSSAFIEMYNDKLNTINTRIKEIDNSLIACRKSNDNSKTIIKLLTICKENKVSISDNTMNDNNCDVDYLIAKNINEIEDNTQIINEYINNRNIFMKSISDYNEYIEYHREKIKHTKKYNDKLIKSIIKLEANSKHFNDDISDYITKHEFYNEIISMLKSKVIETVTLAKNNKALLEVIILYKSKFEYDEKDKWLYDNFDMLMDVE